jgi:diguanylate cyclase (GGDEF)-like protein
MDADYQRTMEGWQQLIHPDDRSRMDHYFKEDVLNQKKSFNQEYRIKRQNDHAERWIHCLGELDFNAQGPPVLMKGTIQDITKQKLAEAHLQSLANFDQLTKLPNRFMRKDKITYLFILARRKKEPVTMIFLDLDHFKNVNDTLGHIIGDQLLIKMANRLKSTIHEVGLVSRVGSDEFILIFPNTDADRAMTIATKLIETVSKPAFFEHHELFIMPTIGIAIYPNDGNDFKILIKNADTTISYGKKYSRHTFYFFTKEMQVHLQRKLKIVNAMRYALQRNEMQVHYQPQVSALNGHTIGAEALLRWNHPELGAISPGESIPIAESSRQIVAIGEWVLRTAIDQIKAWQDEGIVPMVVAVNLPVLQFKQANLLGMIIGMLDEAQLAHQYLELELTEAITMEDPQQAVNIMNQFHTQGIRMSIDDFGTDYSSQATSSSLRFTNLKLINHLFVILPRIPMTEGWYMHY